MVEEAMILEILVLDLRKMETSETMTTTEEGGLQETKMAETMTEAVAVETYMEMIEQVRVMGKMILITEVEVEMDLTPILEVLAMAETLEPVELIQADAKIMILEMVT